jgi:hypothetical protein
MYSSSQITWSTNFLMHGGLLTTMEITARNMAKRELEEEQFTYLVHAWSPCRSMRYPGRHRSSGGRRDFVKEKLHCSPLMYERQ